MISQDAQIRIDIPALLLDYDQASVALSLSRRTLEAMVATGEIPHVRCGRSVRFSVDALREWIAQKVVDNSEVNPDD